MNRDEPTKNQRRLLRHLAGTAYERELGKALEDLQAHFERWRRGEIDAFELNDLVHKYHNGAAREIWKQYESTNIMSIRLQVGAAIADGILAREEVPAEVSNLIEPILDFYAEVERD